MWSARERDVLAAAAMVERGVLPDPGGWQDQSHSFVEAFPLAMDEIQQARAEAQRQAAAKK